MLLQLLLAPDDAGVVQPSIRPCHGGDDCHQAHVLYQ